VAVKLLRDHPLTSVHPAMKRDAQFSSLVTIWRPTFLHALQI
jgi:hypothetical protein